MSRPISYILFILLTLGFYVNVRNIATLDIPTIWLFSFLVIYLSKPAWGIGFKACASVIGVLLVYGVLKIVLNMYNGRLSGGDISVAMEVPLVVYAGSIIGCQPRLRYHVLVLLMVGFVISNLIGIGAMMYGDWISDIQNGFVSMQDTNAFNGEIDAYVRSNSGVSVSLFQFSYQVAAICGLWFAYELYVDKQWYQLRKMFVSAICVISLITISERSVIVSITVALLFAFIARFNFRNRQYTIIRILPLVAVGVILYSITTTDGFWSGQQMHTIFDRDTQAQDIVRPIAALVAMKSAIHDVIGNGGSSEMYNSWALTSGWQREGIPIAPHNVYANISMYLGWPGIIIMCYVLYYVYMKVRHSLKKKSIAIGVSLLSVVINGMFHNSGLFTADPPSCLFLGILCGTLFVEDNIE